jgi:hypothetical protein
VEYQGEARYDHAGNVSGAGDVDADGYDDQLVGSNSIRDGVSATYLVFGSASPASASLSTAVKYQGETAYDYAGSAVSSAGDVDADGYGDFLVGATGHDGGGELAGVGLLDPCADDAPIKPRSRAT